MFWEYLNEQDGTCDPGWASKLLAAPPFVNSEQLTDIDWGWKQPRMNSAEHTDTRWTTGLMNKSMAEHLLFTREASILFTTRHRSRLTTQLRYYFSLISFSFMLTFQNREKSIFSPPYTEHFLSLLGWVPPPDRCVKRSKHWHHPAPLQTSLNTGGKVGLGQRGKDREVYKTEIRERGHLYACTIDRGDGVWLQICSVRARHGLLTFCAKHAGIMRTRDATGAGMRAIKGAPMYRLTWPLVSRGLYS